MYKLFIYKLLIALSLGLLVGCGASSGGSSSSSSSNSSSNSSSDSDSSRTYNVTNSNDTGVEITGFYIDDATNPTYRNGCNGTNLLLSPIAAGATTSFSTSMCGASGLYNVCYEAGGYEFSLGGGTLGCETADVTVSAVIANSNSSRLTLTSNSQQIADVVVYEFGGTIVTVVDNSILQDSPASTPIPAGTTTTFSIRNCHPTNTYGIAVLFDGNSDFSNLAGDLNNRSSSNPVNSFVRLPCGEEQTFTF